MKPFLQYKTSGVIWRAGSTIYGLCSAYNHATNPNLYLSDFEHKRSFAYARAIKNRMKRLGYVYGLHFSKMSNGAFWPKKEVIQ